MEFNPQNAEKLRDDSGQARPYTCAFCKKGFSNAQALGGHMNIHRRDRAKLKQLSSDEENFLSLDITIKNPTTTTTTDHHHHQPHHHKPSNSEEEKVLFQLDSGEDKNYTNILHKKVIDINGSSAEVLKKNIPVFEDKKIEIDLELRLGPI